MRVVAGVDLGGTAVNYTISQPAGAVPDRSACANIPRRSKEGPGVCLQQIVDGLKIAVENLGLNVY